MDKIDRKIIEILQKDIPILPNPYKTISDGLNISVEELLERIKNLQNRKIMRRLGAVLHHRQLGIQGNVMAVWKVSPQDKQRFIETVLKLSQVSHFYERKTYPQWPYNMYTMIHGKDKQDCLKTIEKIKQKTGVKDFEMLFTKKEYKKTSMKYF